MVAGQVAEIEFDAFDDSGLTQCQSQPFKAWIATAASEPSI